MRILDDDIQLCVDCTMLAVNGELPEDPKTERACLAGLATLQTAEQQLVSYSTDEDNGEIEFSKRSCECCGSHLAGTRQRFTLLTSAPLPAAEAAELEKNLAEAEAEARKATDALEAAEETIAELRETISDLRVIAEHADISDIRARWILERAEEVSHANS